MNHGRNEKLINSGLSFSVHFKAACVVILVLCFCCLVCVCVCVVFFCFFWGAFFNILTSVVY